MHRGGWRGRGGGADTRPRTPTGTVITYERTPARRQHNFGVLGVDEVPDLIPDESSSSSSSSSLLTPDPDENIGSGLYVAPNPSAWGAPFWYSGETQSWDEPAPPTRPRNTSPAARARRAAWFCILLWLRHIVPHLRVLFEDLVDHRRRGRCVRRGLIFARALQLGYYETALTLMTQIEVEWVDFEPHCSDEEDPSDRAVDSGPWVPREIVLINALVRGSFRPRRVPIEFCSMHGLDVADSTLRYASVADLERWIVDESCRRRYMAANRVTRADMRLLLTTHVELGQVPTLEGGLALPRTIGRSGFAGTLDEPETVDWEPDVVDSEPEIENLDPDVVDVGTAEWAPLQQQSDHIHAGEW